MAKYVKVVRKEIETDNVLDLLYRECSRTPCEKCPMLKAYKRDKTVGCVDRFKARPNYWIKKFGWEVEGNE